LKETRYLVITLVMALATAVYVYSYLTDVSREVEVVVAAVDVPAYTKLTADEVRLERVPEEGVHSQAFNLIADVVGRHALEPLVAGEQVLAARVTGGGNPLVESIGRGLRASFVPLGREGPGGAIRPGDRVDLVYVGDGELGTPVARTILHAVRVLDLCYEEQPGRSRRGLPAGALVAVTPQQAEVLAFALEYGSVHVTLNGCEPGPSTSSGVTSSMFLEFAGSADSGTPREPSPEGSEGRQDGY